MYRYCPLLCTLEWFMGYNGSMLCQNFRRLVKIWLIRSRIVISTFQVEKWHSCISQKKTNTSLGISNEQSVRCHFVGFFFTLCILHSYNTLKAFKILNYNAINHGTLKIKKNIGIFEDHGAAKATKSVKHRTTLIPIHIDL